MRIVELFGVSGVGKSAIYYALEPKGDFVPNPMPSYESAKILVGIASRYDSEVAAFVKILNSICDTATGPRLDTRRSFLWRSLAKLVMARKYPDSGSVMVVDGGLIQRALTVEKLKCAISITTFLRAMPLPDVAIHCTASPATIEARNKARGGDHDRSDDIPRATDIFAMAAQIVKERGGDLRVINTDMPLVDTCATVREWIQALA